MKTVVENCWDIDNINNYCLCNVVEWSFFLVPSDELIVVKNNACAGSDIDGTICTKFASLQRSCQSVTKPPHHVNLDDDEFIRHGQLRSKAHITLRKACEQWISSIRS